MKRRPLTVTLTTTANYPGTLSNVYYDFNGDDIADLTTNSTASLTHTYSTNGQFFPVVTVQTSVGRFSSQGGWNSFSVDPSNQPPRVNVQASPVLVSTISVTDPVDIKWTTASNLYVLSGSSATITEYNSSGTSIRSLSSIGSSPTGLDVDAAGNVYVAMNGNNQVWRYNPTTSSFAVDTSFGTNGCIGKNNGATGTNNAQFNAPYDVAISPDGSTISVSDSGNNRIQQFDTNGNYIATFGSSGTNIGQFNSPAGLTYDNFGDLYIADSGNDRIAIAESTSVTDISGSAGSVLGQFNSPINVNLSNRGIYVADLGNNRVQVFNPNAGLGAAQSPFVPRVTLSSEQGLSDAGAVVAVPDFLYEYLYIADTGNDRVLLVKLPSDNPKNAWTSMTNHLVTGDIEGAVSFFSTLAADEYRKTFLALGTNNLIPVILQTPDITPSVIEQDSSEYYFTDTINGQVITFPIEFIKENGIWKIDDY